VEHIKDELYSTAISTKLSQVYVQNIF